ncbi:MAG: DinB family protein [Planctomycetota bacterium]
MDLLDRLLRHDYRTSRVLLELAVPLADEQLDQPFEFGLGTLRKTLDHLVQNVEGWTAVLEGAKESPPRDPSRSPSDMLASLDAWYPRFAGISRRVRDGGRWDEMWQDDLSYPARSRPVGGVIAHLITHSMHHRAQVLGMLRNLGVEDVPEGDALEAEAWDPAPDPT